MYRSQQNSVESEVLRRFAREREERELSYRQLAQELSEAGTPIAASSLQKMLSSATPRRPLSVDEFLSFCRVLGLSPSELLNIGTPESASLSEQWGLAAEEALSASDLAIRRSLAGLRSSLTEAEAASRALSDRREQISAARRSHPTQNAHEYLLMDQQALTKLRARIDSRLSSIDAELAKRPPKEWDLDG